MRIGVLGGTFDPPHEGHLALARAAADALNLDEVIFLPTHRNPLKKDAKQTGAKKRMEMVRLATKNEPAFAVSDIEVERKGLSYAVDTMRQLQMVRPGDYWFILGADALKDFKKWKQPEKLLKLARLAVAVRPPETFQDAISRIPEQFRARIDAVPMPPVEISSTEIRERISGKRPVSQWVPRDVLQYIEENRLYRS